MTALRRLFLLLRPIFFAALTLWMLYLAYKSDETIINWIGIAGVIAIYVSMLMYGASGGRSARGEENSYEHTVKREKRK